MNLFDDDELDFGTDEDFSLETSGNNNGTDAFEANSPDNNITDIDDDNMFDGSFGETGDSGEANSPSTKKSAIIIIIIGLIIVVTVFIVAMKIRNKASDSENKQVATQQTVQNQQYVEQTVSDVTKSASEILNDGHTNVSDTQAQEHSIIKEYNDLNYWVEIDGSSDIEFESEYKDLTFYITDIEHYVATIEGSDSIVVKTTLTGSLSGMAGTYKLDIPYSKGVQLGTGQQFTVHVQIGTYKDKIVVGEILY